MSLIQHKTLRQEAVDTIRNLILTGELERGGRIVEQDLVNRLGVSRGPIRESLRQLEQEGLVEYSANRGCVVRQVSLRDILEIDLIQLLLETMALELQGGALPDEVLHELEQAVERMAQKGEQSTLGDILEEDRAFHRPIVQSVHMTRLYQLWSGMSQSSVELLKRFEQDKKALIALHRELHVTLLGALKTKDMAVIRRAMMNHCIEVVGVQSQNDESLGFDLNNLLKSAGE